LQVARELIIIGTSGLAREAAQLARQIDPKCKRWDQVSFVAKKSDQLGQSFTYGLARYLDSDLSSRQLPTDVVIGIGHPKIRRKVAERLNHITSLSFPNLIHPTVFIDESCVNIGRGNMIAMGVVMTCDITIGDFNLVNWNVTIGHDVSIGSYNVLNPGSNVSGWVSIADACLFGTGCQLLEHRTISNDITVGAGAVVTRSLVSTGATYVGIPARQVEC
jgi:sugar O-acyltransferase (sialic acid O-acetyltransferase NeuD family)